MQQSGQRAAAVAEALYRSAKSIEHGYVQVRSGSVLAADQMLSGVDPASRLSGQHQRHMVRIVLVAVAQRRAKQDHRIVEDRRVSFFHALQLAEKIGVLL